MGTWVSPAFNLWALAHTLQQDCNDSGTGIMKFKVDTQCLPPQSHFEFGLKSALTLLDQACNAKVLTVNQHCQRWAKLVQAYIACPSAVEEQVKTGKLRLPCVLNALDDLQPAEAAFMCVTKMLALQLQSLVSSSDCTARHKSPTDAEFSALLHTQHLPLYTSVLRLCHDMKEFKDVLTEIGLSYQDIEWWSRAIMLRTVMQVAVKHKVMSDEVAAQAVRHSDRLIELLPDNPASHEFAFHAAMHSPAPEPDFVCRHMHWAMDGAARLGDYAGVAQYAMQVMYFMLWTFSLSQSKQLDALVLEAQVRQVLAILQDAEASSRQEPQASEGGSPFCWHPVANMRFYMATLTLARLAFAIPDCPQQLREYLQHVLTKVPAAAKTEHPKPQRDMQNKLRKDVKAGCGTCSRSKPEWQSKDSSCTGMTSGAKGRQGTAAVQIQPAHLQ